MTSKISIFFILLVLTFQSYSQIDLNVRRRKLKTTFFDTSREKIFIYEVPNAILYFKQADIEKFIDNPKNKYTLVNYGHEIFQDTLATNTQQIKVKDIYFYYDQVQRDSILRHQPENPLTKKLNDEFYFIGAALILKGQFMVYSKSNKKFVRHGLIAKQQKDYPGLTTLLFYLPGKKKFYSIITALGE